MAKPPSCLFLDQGRELIILSNGCLDPFANLLIGNMVLGRNVQKCSIASLRPTFYQDVVKVHDSQAYNRVQASYLKLGDVLFGFSGFREKF